MHTFFDWNEVRVTSISELSEVMACLPDPRAAANRVKRVLHAVFETTFNFDLEDLRKKNLGPTVKWLEKLDGTTRFTVAYVGPGGAGRTRHPHRRRHDGGPPRARPGDRQGRRRRRGAGPWSGAVAKSKGVEFGSLLHELGAQFSANPYSPDVREILLADRPGVRRAGCPSGGPTARQKPASRPSRPPPPRSTRHAEDRPAQEPAAAGGAPAAKAQQPTARSRRSRRKKKPAPHPESYREPLRAKKTLRAHRVPPRNRPASEGLSKRKPR